MAGLAQTAIGSPVELVKIKMQTAMMREKKERDRLILNQIEGLMKMGELKVPKGITAQDILTKGPLPPDLILPAETPLKGSLYYVKTIYRKHQIRGLYQGAGIMALR